MDRLEIVLLVVGLVLLAAAQQTWTSWLEHQRRTKALDVIKAAYEAGRDPPRELFEEFEAEPYAMFGLSKRPWAEAIVFGAVGGAFWIAYAMGAGDDRQQTFLLVAALMTLFAIVCAVLAFFRPGQRPRDGQ